MELINTIKVVVNNTGKPKSNRERLLEILMEKWTRKPKGKI